MAQVAYEVTALTGGGANALDFIDGSVINNGDFAFAKVNGKLYYYRANTAGSESEDSPIVIVPDTNPGATINWELGGCNQLITINKTASWSVSAAYLQAGVVITNTGDVDQAIGTLPAAVVGYGIGGRIEAAQYLQFLCNGTDTVSDGFSTSAAGGYVRSNTANTYWYMKCFVTGKWTLTELNGLLLFDE